MTDGESAGVVEDTPPSRPRAAPTADVRRPLEEARRLQAVAERVHKRSRQHQVDSVAIAARALAQALEALLRANSEPSPPDFDALITRASGIARSRNAWEPELDETLKFIWQMASRFREPGFEPSRVECRRYDRALIDLHDLVAWVGAEVDRSYPDARRDARRSWLAVATLALGLIGGFFAGTRVRVAAPVAPVSPASTEREVPPPNVPALEATYYRDVELREEAYSLRDASLAFDWKSGGPSGLGQADNFGVRWTGRFYVPESGDYDFHLTSDDGSRLFIDDALAIDDWGDHAPVTLHVRKNLVAGEHPLKVEYYDRIGDAILRLEWDGQRLERRVLGAGDLR